MTDVLLTSHNHGDVDAAMQLVTKSRTLGDSAVCPGFVRRRKQLPSSVRAVDRQLKDVWVIAGGKLIYRRKPE
jgi:hypothetical protein